MAELQKPLVSVLMPAFNHEAYVEAAVRSVMRQTYPNVELVAIDDGSTDETPVILDRLSKELDFTFIRNEQNIGINATLDRAMEQSRGDYLSILASDDLILPGKIARQVEHAQAHGFDAVYANGFLLSPEGRQVPINLEEARRHHASGTLLQLAYCDDTKLPLLQSGLFRREAMLALAPYRREFQSDDWVILIKLLERYRVSFLDERLFLYRQHAANSYRRCWQTLPMRIDVIARVTPASLRARAMATILASHARALREEGQKPMARRFWLASLAFDGSPARAIHWARNRLAAAIRKLAQLANQNVQP
jgi:alpha-1,3-rhamnosyltransferase